MFSPKTTDSIKVPRTLSSSAASSEQPSAVSRTSSFKTLCTNELSLTVEVERNPKSVFTRRVLGVSYSLCLCSASHGRKSINLNIQAEKKGLTTFFCFDSARPWIHWFVPCIFVTGINVGSYVMYLATYNYIADVSSAVHYIVLAILS